MCKVILTSPVDQYISDTSVVKEYLVVLIYVGKQYIITVYVKAASS